MIKFKQISVSNFMSFGKKPTVIPLDREGVTLIIGNNEDVGTSGESRNGTGKSTVLQAVVFALYGKGLDKLKTDEFINVRNGNKLEVILVLEKDGKKVEIIRKRKPNSLSLVVDGEDVTLDSMRNTEMAIEKLIGITYEVFLTVFLMTPHRDSFMAMSGPDQRAMIESMLSLDVLTERAEAIKAIRRDEEVELKLLGRDLENAESVNTRAQAAVRRLGESQKTFEDDRARTIGRYQNDLEGLSDVPEVELRGELERIEEVERKNEIFVKKIRELENAKHQFEVEIPTVRGLIREKSVLGEQIEATKRARDSFGIEERNTIKKIEERLEGADVDSIQNRLETAEVMIELDKTKHELESLREISLRNVEKTQVEIKDMERDLEVLRSGKCYTCKQAHVGEDARENIDELLGRIDVLLDEAKTEHDRVTELDGRINELLELREATFEEWGSLSVEDERNKLTQIERDIAEKTRLEMYLKTNPHDQILGDLVNKFEGGDSLDVLVSLLEECEENVSNIEKEIQEIRGEVQTVRSPLLAEWNINNSSDVDVLTTRKDSLISAMNEEKERVNPYVSELEEAKKGFVDVSEITDKIAAVEERITHCGYLVRLLTDSKSFVRKSIVDMYIPLVNKKILEYTEKLGLLHVATINSDLSTNIEYMQKPVSYYNLSQGERLRLNLSTNLAFRDLLGLMGTGSNLLAIDEFFDGGCDHAFIYPAYGLIRQKADAVMLISHRSEFVDVVDHVMTVTKRGGFSSID